jgi:alanine racemase
MTGQFNRTKAVINLRAIEHNFEILCGKVPAHELIPMVKANAYGHGVGPVVQTLGLKKKTAAFGVATLKEAEEVRHHLTAKHLKHRVMVFSNTSPWSESMGQYCQQFNLSPVLSSTKDLDSFLAQRWDKRLTYDLKFNTGMNRLGIPLQDVPRILKGLKKLSEFSPPQTVLTHLACAENPTHALTKSQVRGFKEIIGQFTASFSTTRFHLANSAAIANSKALGIESFTSLSRPGISLYGARPWPESKDLNLKPTLSLQARVLSTAQIKKGQTVGYGALYKCKKPKQAIAILGAGYADGIHRTLSEKGDVWLSGGRQKILGRVSMDLVAVSSPPKAPNTGDWAEFYGEHLDVWNQALMAQTIPYELFTAIGPRVIREYLF